MIRILLFSILSLLVVTACDNPLTDPSETVKTKGILAPPDSIPTMTDTRDGKRYPYVTLGSQTWLAENVSFMTGLPAQCPGYDSSNCTSLGSLYRFQENYSSNTPDKGKNAIPILLENVCPEKYHIPTASEWMDLINFLTAHANYPYQSSPDHYPLGQYLKAPVGWDDGLPISNDFNFWALATDISDYSYSNDNRGQTTTWWTSTQSDTTGYNYHIVQLVGDNLSVTSASYGAYHSVRCILDSTVPQFKTLLSDNFFILDTMHVGQVLTRFHITDSDSDTLAFAITTGDTSGTLSIDTSGVLRLAKAIDFKTTPEFLLTIEVSDGTNSTTHDISIVVGSLMYDTRDQQAYTIHQYDNALWMSSDLRYSSDPSLHTCTSVGDSIGCRYSWYTLMNVEPNINGNIIEHSTHIYQGICPTGWHIPTWGEWDNMGRTLQNTKKVSYPFLHDGNSTTAYASTYENDNGSTKSFSRNSWYDPSATGVGQKSIVAEDWKSMGSEQSVRCVYHGSKPVFDQHEYRFAIATTLPPGDSVGTVHATTISSEPVVYSIISGNDTGLFDISPTTGTITATEALNDIVSTTEVLHIQAQAESDTAKVLARITVKSGFVDTRDSNSYAFVAIDGVNWMAENLRYNAPGSTCENDYESNCTVYGRQYTWPQALLIDETFASDEYGHEIIRTQGVCPEDWYLPNRNDWASLMAFMGDSSYIDSANLQHPQYEVVNHLKLENQWSDSHWDRYGFSARKSASEWWSSTELDSRNSWSFRITTPLTGSIVWHSFKGYPYYVRCVQPNESAEFEFTSYTGYITNLNTIGDTLITLTTIVSDPSNLTFTITGTDSEHFTYAPSTGGLILTGDVSVLTSRSTLEFTITASNDFTSTHATVTLNTTKAFVDDRDGTSYRYTSIDTLDWMTENLNFKTALSHCLNNSEEHCARYGSLYTWADVLTLHNSKNSELWDPDSTYYQGICPEGWSVPTFEQWVSLAETVDTQSPSPLVRDAEQRPYLYTVIVNPNSWSPAFDTIDDLTDLVGFDAKRSGYVINGSHVWNGAFWWSAINATDTDAWAYEIQGKNKLKTELHEMNKRAQGSLRCVRRGVD
ncbi:MAG: hypothetical protein OCD01_14565 [Fibrobacterales bacterium]